MRDGSLSDTAHRLPRCSSDNERWMVRAQLLGVSYPQIRRLLAKIGKQVGIERLHPRGLRAAFVTEALRAGVALDRMQYAASHSDPRTTQGYDRRALDLDGHPAHVVAGLVGA